MNGAPTLPRQHPAHRREEQPVPAAQLGALDLATEHGEFVAQDQHLSFGVRGDPTQPQNAPNDRIEHGVEHGGRCYEIAGPGANRVSVPYRRYKERNSRRGEVPEASGTLM
jgi:hypothetical protein